MNWLKIKSLKDQSQCLVNTTSIDFVRKEENTIQIHANTEIETFCFQTVEKTEVAYGKILESVNTPLMTEIECEKFLKGMTHL